MDLSEFISVHGSYAFTGGFSRDNSVNYLFLLQDIRHHSTFLFLYSVLHNAVSKNFCFSYFPLVSGMSCIFFV